MVTVIQEEHKMSDMEIGDGASDTWSSYNFRYGGKLW